MFYTVNICTCKVSSSFEELKCVFKIFLTPMKVKIIWLSVSPEQFRQIGDTAFLHRTLHFTHAFSIGFREAFRPQTPEPLNTPPSKTHCVSAAKFVRSNRRTF